MTMNNELGNNVDGIGRVLLFKLLTWDFIKN